MSDTLKIDEAALMGASRDELIKLAKQVSLARVTASKIGPQTDDELHAFIKDKWGLHLPRVAVSPGMSAPFDFISDVFFHRETSVIAVANREGGKTNSAAIIHALFANFYPGYEGISAGAIGEQTKRVYQSLKRLNKMWGQDKVKESQATHIEWLNGSVVEPKDGTAAQMNGPHSWLLHRDEIEQFRREAFNEADNITKSGTTTDGRMFPATDIYTTSRKKAHGLLQEMLDKVEDAEKGGTIPPYKVYIWGVAETIQNQPGCQMTPENAGRPECDLCNCHRYVNGKLSDGSPRSLAKVCGGRFFKSDGWRPREPDISGKFMANSAAMWDAQQECSKPATEGLILGDFSKETHGIQGWVPDPEIGKIYQGIDYGGCYDEETEVLTERGWIKFSEATLFDKFASMNPETEEVEFIFPEEIINKPYNGKMNHWKNNSVDLLVTEDHNMVVAPLTVKKPGWNLVASKDVRDSSRMMKTSAGRVDAKHDPMIFPGLTDGRFKIYEDLVIEAEDWAAFLGLWMAEGHTYLGFDGNGKPRSTGHVGITHYDEKNILEIKSIMDKYVNARNQVNFETVRGQLIINDPRIFAHLYPLGKAGEKRLPKYVKQWSKELLLIMLDWHERGDGSRSRIYTGSRLLADDLQEIAMYAGLAADITVRPPRDSTMSDGRVIHAKLDQYTVSLKKIQNRPRVHHNKHQNPTRSVVSSEEWAGKNVYCVSLPKWHTLYVRRNGKAVWCGNSNAQSANWYQYVEKMTSAIDYSGNFIIIPADSYVVFGEIYMSEIGNNKFANLIKDQEATWKNTIPFFEVEERYADIAAKSARLDFLQTHGMRTAWRITREINEHILIIQDLVSTNRIFIDSSAPMWSEEAESWQWDDNGKQLDTFNHAMSNARYAIANIERKLISEKRHPQNRNMQIGSSAPVSSGQTATNSFSQVPNTGPVTKKYMSGSPHESNGSDLPIHQGPRPAFGMDRMM